MITLIGVGHVFDLRAAVRRTIEERRPSVVGVELDPSRFQALRQPERRARRVGLYSFIALVQRRIASAYGSEAGSEMLEAADAARAVGARLAFIDLDSRAVLMRLLRSMSMGERVRFLISVLGGLFVRKERVEEEIRRFEDDQAAFFAELAQEFPAVKRVLIDERNEHMARRIRDLETGHGSVVAVVGDGHVEGLRALLADRSPHVVRLRELRNPPASGTSSVTVSFST